ncbi:MAG: NAAT family transporter [Armatimonadetes bacterium]|nr:NAAT family transporter [Armatimonadota bacterium]
MLDFGTLLKMLVSLFAVVNPIGTAPLFLGMTGDFPTERGRTARLAALTCTIALLVSAAAGEQILSLFGISVASFRVIGGILFLFMAMDMLNVRPSRTKVTPEEETEAADRRQIAFVPLGIPMLAGPGAISTVLLYMNEGRDTGQKAMVYIVILSTGLLVWMAMSLAAPLGKLLGTTGTNILTRLMGLIVGAIGVEYLVGGLKQLLPGLG